MPRSKAPRMGGLGDLIGRELADRYRIVRLIAKGGMGAVYEAEQLPLGRRVAVKVLVPPANTTDEAGFERRFFLEASTLARLNHPHTVTLHDYGQTTDGIFYLVMEYVEGRPLSQVLRAEGPFLPDRTIKLMLQVARALRNAHRMGVVHRDLKPSNILVRTDPEGEEVVKVVDFGLVKLTDGDQSITVTGVIMGSPHCMSPEQVQGLDIDERADIYALGVLLFRCITNQYPFHGSTTTATMIAHIQEDIPRMSDITGAALPDGMDEFVNMCLQKDKEDRWPDMRTFIRELSHISDAGTDEFSAVSTLMDRSQTAPEPRPAKRNRVVPIVLGLVAVGVIGAGGLLAAKQYFDKTRVESTRVEATPVVAPAAPASVEVAFRTQPEGVRVSHKGEVLGTTPFVQRFTLQGTPDVRQFTFELEGYETRDVERDVSGGEIEMELDKVEGAPAPVEEPEAAPEPVVEKAPTPVVTKKKTPPKQVVKEPESSPAATTKEPAPDKDPPPKDTPDDDPYKNPYEDNPYDE